MIVANSGPHVAKIARLEDELEIARERIRELEAALGTGDDLPLRMLGLSPSAARIASALFTRNYATKEQLRLAIYLEDPDHRFDVLDKTIDTQICQTRQKLRQLGVTFSALTKQPIAGYRMPGPDKARLARLIASKANLIAGHSADMRQPAQRLRAQMGAA